MATSKTLTPTNVTIQIPDFTDQPDQRVNSNCIDKEADAINSLNTAIAALGSFESLGTASSLANLESALLTKAQAMSMNEVRPVKIATTFSTNGFVSNASYGGFLKVLYKSGNNLYFTITFDGIISSSVKPIYMMYNDGTWEVNQLAQGGLTFTSMEISTSGKTAGTAFEVDLPTGFTSSNIRMISSCYLFTSNSNLYSETAYDSSSISFRIVATSTGKLNITPNGSQSTAGTLKITLARA